MRLAWPIALIGGVLLLCGSFYAQSNLQQAGGWHFEQVQFYPSGSHLGVGLTDINADRASALKLGEPRGVEVRTVEENSPAARAGIQAGDVLLTYNGEEILSGPQLGRLVGETPPDRKVKIEYWRDGKTKTTIAVLSAGAAKSADSPAPMSTLQAWNVPDIPRMLMLWDNFALGIECEPIDSQIAQYFGVESGILIRRVEKGYVADKAGLKAGDVITEIDTRSISGPRDLISYLRTRHQPAKSISIEVVRDHKTRTFSIPLAE